MKIDRLDSLLNLVIPDKKGSAHKAGGNDFQKILEEIQANQSGEKKGLRSPVPRRRKFPTVS